MNFAFPATLALNRGGDPSGHGAQPCLRSHVPMDLCLNSGQPRQNEADSGTATILRRAPARSTRVTLVQDRRKRACRSPTETRNPYPDPVFEAVPFDQAAQTISPVGVVVRRPAPVRPKVGRR